jgi:hypothetical protein
VSVGAVDVRVTVFDPKLTTVYTFDAAELMQDFGGGSIQYEDTPAGCGSATLNLGLRDEDIFLRGYWSAMNIVEISTGDAVVTTPFSSGATKVYVDSNAGFDNARCPDIQQAYFFDGSTLTMRVPVATSVGTDGGGQYITIGAPLGGGSIPAYGVGTIVGRRRYCGRIVRVSRPHQRQPQATVTCVGMMKALDNAVGSFTVTDYDVGSAIYQALSQFAGRWPFFYLASGNFPTVGQVYGGSNQTVPVSRFIANVLTGITNGDLWVVRVGHDRTPRLVKLYTSSSNVYAYNVTLRDGVTAFEPQNVLIDAEDASNLFNSVIVVGDTNPVTKQPFRAEVQDTGSIALYGQLDAQPTQNSQCKSTAACAGAAATLLKQSSLATSNNTFRVYTRNDDAAPVNQPAGLASGDVLCGVDNVILTRFDGTGTTRNMLGDSNFNATAWFWTFAAGVAVLPNYPSATLNAVVMTGNGSAFAGGTRADQTAGIDVAVGQALMLACTVDATNVTAGSPQIQIRSSVGGTVLASASIAAGTGATRIHLAVPYTVVSSGILYVSLDANGCTVTNGAHLLFYFPQIERASVASSYVVNPGAANEFGLVSSALTTLDAHGDRWQDVKFQAIQPDWQAAIAQRANAQATALVANRALSPSLDSFFVSASAWPPTFSPSSFVVTVPTFQAVFGDPAHPQIAGGNTFTLPPSTVSWAWLAPDNSWTINQNPEGQIGTIVAGVFSVSIDGDVSGSILYGVFQTDASGVIGAVQKCVIGALNLPVSYLINGLPVTPTVTAVSISTGKSGVYSTPLSINFTITNQPTDGSLSKIMLYYRESGTAVYLQLNSDVPRDGSGTVLTGGATSVTGVYSLTYPDSANLTSYDFAVAEESGASKESAITFLATFERGVSTNLIVDSDFIYASYAGGPPETAITATAWAFDNGDAGFYFQQDAGQQSNELNLLPADVVGEHNITSTPLNAINVTPGQTYTISAFIDATTVT